MQLSPQDFRARVRETQPELRLTSLYVKATGKVSYKCRACKSEGSALPANLVRYGCYTCGIAQRGMNRRRSGSELEKQVSLLHKGTLTVNLPEKPAVFDYFDFHCRCGHLWSARLHNILNGRGCPRCAVVRRHEAVLRVTTKFKSLRLGGRTFRYQGHEHLALRELNERGLLSQVVMSSSEVPRINYRHRGKASWHFPDIWLSRQNRLIEVKSPYTLCGDSDKLLRMKKKITAAEAQGFKYHVWVYTAGHVKIKLPKDWREWSRRRLQTWIKANYTRVGL